MASIFEWTTTIFKFFQNTLGVSPLQVVSKVAEVSENVVGDLRTPKVGYAPAKPTHNLHDDYSRDKDAAEYRMKVKADEAARARPEVSDSPSKKALEAVITNTQNQPDK
jgi:hypothetical protein